MPGMKYNRAEKLKIANQHVVDGVSLDDFVYFSRMAQTDLLGNSHIEKQKIN